MADKYMDTWVTLDGITEGMKNTRVKYLTGQLPTAKNLANGGATYVPAAKSTQMGDTTLLPGAQLFRGLCRKSTTTKQCG